MPVFDHLAFPYLQEIEKARDVVLLLMTELMPDVPIDSLRMSFVIFLEHASAQSLRRVRQIWEIVEAEHTRSIHQGVFVAYSAMPVLHRMAVMNDFLPPYG